MKKIFISIFLLLLIVFLGNQFSYGLTPNRNVNKLNFSALKDGYKLLPLPYDNGSLEPYFDKETIVLHHEKIEQAFLYNYNIEAIKLSKLKGKDIEFVINNPNVIPKVIRQQILNLAGGIYNHHFFWKCLSPQGGGNPTANIESAIETQFGNFENFKLAFENAAFNICGSGWIWVTSDNKGNLAIEFSENEITPSTKNKSHIFCLDLWEHAYFLKHQNRKEEYLASFWNVINWDFAEHNYLNGLKK